MDDKIKWALLAVGAYFLYDWYTNQQAAAAPPGGGSGVGTGTGTGTPKTDYVPSAPLVYGTPKTPWTPTPVEPIGTPKVPWHPVMDQPDSIVAMNAVSGFPGTMYINEARRRGMQYNYHQWNWFRAQATGVEQPDPAEFSANPDMLVSATQYLEDLSRGGLSGLGRYGGPILPWSTAWRA